MSQPNPYSSKPGVSGTPYNPASVAITGGTVSGLTSLDLTGTSVTGLSGSTISESFIPFIFPSSASIGNNGALSALTALPQTYSGGAWMYFDANTIAAGVAAGWYWVVMSTTQAGTIYNSTYTSGTPAKGITTAFATTGPGAFTGLTTEVFGPAIPTGVIGANGRVSLKVHTQHTGNANVKTFRARADGSGGTIFGSWTLTSRSTGELDMDLFNQGTQSVNKSHYYGFGDNNALTQAYLTGTVDFSTSKTLTFSAQRATATDNFIIEGFALSN